MEIKCIYSLTVGVVLLIIGVVMTAEIFFRLDGALLSAIFYSFLAPRVSIAIGSVTFILHFWCLETMDCNY